MNIKKNKMLFLLSLSTLTVAAAAISVACTNTNADQDKLDALKKTFGDDTKGKYALNTIKNKTEFDSALKGLTDADRLTKFAGLLKDNSKTRFETNTKDVSGLVLSKVEPTEKGSGTSVYLEVKLTFKINSASTEVTVEISYAPALTTPTKSLSDVQAALNNKVFSAKDTGTKTVEALVTEVTTQAKLLDELLTPADKTKVEDALKLVSPAATLTNIQLSPKANHFLVSANLNSSTPLTFTVNYSNTLTQSYLDA